MTEYRNDICIYKANNKLKGGVVQFKLGRKNDCVFLEAANQVRPMDDKYPYDWENTKIAIKLGLVDIGKILSYFENQLMYYKNPPETLSLYHQTDDTTNKALELKWQDFSRGGKTVYSYYLTVSAKTPDGLRRTSVPISLDEVEILKIGLKKAVEIILRW